MYGRMPYYRQDRQLDPQRELPMTADLKTGAVDAATTPKKPLRLKFSGYETFVVALLAFFQFSIILDFMIISPLGAIIMPDLDIGPQRFGEIVSAYAFSAGVSGILAAAFADRFDRKRFLLFFYCGFIAGTAFCALAPNYPMLLLARIVTTVRRGHRLDCTCHRHRPIPASEAGPSDRRRTDCIFRQPSLRHPHRTVHR